MAHKSHVLSLLHGSTEPRSPDSQRSNANEKSTSSLYFEEPMLQAGRLERLVKRSLGGGHTVTKWSARCVPCAFAVLCIDKTAEFVMTVKPLNRTATLTTGSLRLHEDQDSPDLDDEIRLLDIDVLEKNEVNTRSASTQCAFISRIPAANISGLAQGTYPYWVLIRATRSSRAKVLLRQGCQPEACRRFRLGFSLEEGESQHRLPEAIFYAQERLHRIL